MWFEVLAFGLPVLGVASLWLFRKKKINLEAALRGKNAIVTGGSGYIGEQLAYVFARHGANVVVTARRKEELEKVVARCKELNPTGKFAYVVGDMQNYRETSAEVVKSAVSEMGGIDYLFLNHAYLPEMAHWEDQTKEQQIQAVHGSMEINYFGSVHLFNEALPFLRLRPGAGVGIVSTLMGKLGFPYTVAFGASKFALDGFFTAMRAEFLETDVDISVSLFVLGLIDHEGLRSALEPFVNRYNMDLEKMRASGPSATADAAALEMVTQLLRKKREHFFPAGWIMSWMPVVRYLNPNWAVSFNSFKKN